MKVLITEAHVGDAAGVAGRLRAAGHDLVACHPRAGQGGPCAAARPGGACPLWSGDVDAVVDCRGAGGRLTARERGVLCALAGDIPLVVCGPAPANGPWSRADTRGTEDTVGWACAHAVSPTSASSRRAVATAVHRVLRGQGLAPAVAVWLTPRTVPGGSDAAAGPSAGPGAGPAPGLAAYPAYPAYPAHPAQLVVDAVVLTPEPLPERVRGLVRAVVRATLLRRTRHAVHSSVDFVVGDPDLSVDPVHPGQRPGAPART